MAPFNLENNIREKLENRELKPSSDAWGKLEIQLEERKPKKKLVFWYYAAASVVGILILSSIFINRNNPDENIQLVEKQVKEISVEKPLDIIPNTSEEIVVLENNSKVSNRKEDNTERQIKSVPPKNESTVDKKIRKNEAIVESSEMKKDIIKEEDQFINDKASEVALNIKNIQNNNSEVTLEEVETLLNNARRDIQTQRILNSQKVDATALLQEVEWELDKSFRDKVFDALGEGFQKVRTAVTERND